MAKTFLKDAEDCSSFLASSPVDVIFDTIGERAETGSLRAAREIDIERIAPDPDQPRKHFNQEALESLADSIREVGEIIEPLTVEYDQKEDCFRIVSGERRYRAARIVGIRKLPCIVKEYDDRKRLLVQFIANLQREGLSALEESAGIKALIKRFGYSQTKAAKVLNKSESYISQILGLQRLSDPAREILQTSEVSKEAQIQASRESDPNKQRGILIEASKEGRTIRHLREGRGSKKKMDLRGKNVATKSRNSAAEEAYAFREWIWESPDKGFSISIKFSQEQDRANKTNICRKALKAALASTEETTATIFPTSQVELKQRPS